MQYDDKFFRQSAAYDPNAQPTSAFWVVGESGSGKTARLIEHLTRLCQSGERDSRQILVFAASRANRAVLESRLAERGLDPAQIHLTTPIGFWEAEVVQFWPLLTQVLAALKLKLPAHPLRLRPEKEQELATQLWQSAIDSGRFRQRGLSSSALVNRTLGFLQLAASSGMPHEQIALILQEGLPTSAPDPFTADPLAEAAENEPPPASGSVDLWLCVGELLERWWHWCLSHGLLTYSILTELYWRYLLPQRDYVEQLQRRYRAVLADDVDEYPAVMRLLLEGFLQRGPLVCTFNPIGSARLGLRADPIHLAGLAAGCRVETLEQRSDTLASLGRPVLEGLQNPLQLLQLPDAIQVIQTTTKAQLLRQVAEQIGGAVRSGQVQPSEIALLGPGLDAITRYTLHSILASQQIPLRSLNSQQPLISTAAVRALLSFMALVYPGLGRLVERETLAELLVVLGQSAGLDPVRAGLLSDHCFVPDPTQPRLLAATEFPRWDRLGYEAMTAYTELVEALETERRQRPHPIALLERLLRRYFGSLQPSDQQTALQQLLETAQHYWQVEARLSLASEQNQAAIANSVGRFIQLLRSGTITANASGTEAIQPQAVTLATVYQYRSQRGHHRWQFWLDAGSSFWLTGGVMLPGAPLFWRERPNRVWTAADSLAVHQANLERAVQDLLSRTTEQIYLCHCELGINGEDQSNGLMALVNAALPMPEAQAP